jgi:BirA family transcriptional regulator, biotin operon repressor / biotin---[acetyl-CoA-carboxylase] ligase
MKKTLLDILSSDPATVFSGESLSSRLGISRVSIWKHIKKLQSLGYNIKSGPKGYQYLDSSDSLQPWEFPGRESLIHTFEQVESTMATAKQLARKGYPDFSVIIAEQQEQGRGRLGRKWTSDRGGLYFTVIIRPKTPIAMTSLFGFAASLCMSEVLQSDLGIEARVKWPNDILVNEKKICGMLSEMETESDEVSFLNIGIGLNVNNEPGKAEPDSVTVKQLLRKSVPRKVILSSFLNRLQAEVSGPSLDHIIPRWKKQTLTLGRRVKIVTTTETHEGVAVDVDENGALLIEQTDQSIKKIYFGDCFHQG